MNSNQIRELIKKAGVFQYEVADELGINEITFIRWLRKPLACEKEESILVAINKLAKKTEGKRNE